MNRWVYIILLALAVVTSCKRKTEPAPQPAGSGYPEEIANILVNKCATSGCHNAASYTGAGGLLTDTWEHLFNGSNNGAVVVPYNTANSSLLYFVNTTPDLGPVAEPAMPYNQPPLSNEEYITLRNWIEAGAPDRNGNIPFGNNPETRQKIYCVQQGCDLVAVIDAATQVIMRYISVGKQFAREQPNNIVISPDGDYAYVSFWNAPLVQKIDTRTDSVVAELATPASYQKAICLSSDGATLIVSNWYSQDMVLISTGNMQMTRNLGQSMEYISGFAATADGGFYAASQFGNTIYKIENNGGFNAISIDGNAPTQTSSAGSPDPYRLCLSPDGKRLIVSCSGTNEVLILNTAGHAIEKVIKTGSGPQELLMSTQMPYLYVSCVNDTIGNMERGSVYVINYETGAVLKKITGGFFQPTAMALNEHEGLLYVFSRNDDKNGPLPHHSGPCAGRNGFYRVYDVRSQTFDNNRRYETSVDPYHAAVRFR